jgi:hypothetical protein
VAPDGIGEVRHGVSLVVDVRRERGVGTPDVVGGRPPEQALKRVRAIGDAVAEILAAASEDRRLR